jgi:uncharacterized protein YciI
MPVFAVTYRYTDDTTTRDAVRPVHREYLRALADRGALLLSGPYGPDEPAGALLLFRAEDKAQVKALIDDDPFTAAGVISTAGIAHWDPVIGPLLASI